MKNTTMMFLGAASLLSLGGIATAYADDAPAPPAPDYQVTAAIAGQSDYRFRGISQNSREFAPQATVNLTAPDGFYAGTWESKVNWGGNNPSYETDFYGGKHFDLGGTDLNVEAYYYGYPDFRAAGGPAASYYETIVQLTHVFGPLTLMVQGSNSPEWALHTGTGWWAAGMASYTVNDWLSISGNVGHQWVDLAPSDYTHFDIGATATWKAFTLDVRYTGSDIGNANCGFWIGTGAGSCGGGPIVTLTYNIADLLHW